MISRIRSLNLSTTRHSFDHPSVKPLPRAHGRLKHILRLLSHLFDGGLQRNHVRRDRAVLNLGADRVGLAGHLLEQEVEALADRCVGFFRSDRAFAPGGSASLTISSVTSERSAKSAISCSRRAGSSDGFGIGKKRVEAIAEARAPALDSVREGRREWPSSVFATSSAGGLGARWRAPRPRSSRMAMTTLAQAASAASTKAASSASESISRLITNRVGHRREQTKRDRLVRIQLVA